MKCNEISPELLLYLDDELNEKERRLVELHLASCPRCREELEAFSETENILRRGFESITARKAPVWAWAELESRLAINGDAKPDRVRGAINRIKGLVSWQPKWKTALTSAISVVLTASSMLVVSSIASPTPEAMASEIVNDTPEVKALTGGEPVVEATRISGAVAYVLSSGASGESNLAYVDLKDGEVTKLFRLIATPLTETEKSGIADTVRADPNVRQILGNQGSVTDVFLLAARLRLEVVDGKPTVWSEGVLANAVLRSDERKWIARVDVSEGKVTSISELGTTMPPAIKDGQATLRYSREELVQMAISDARVNLLLDQGARVAYVATGSRKLANTGVVLFGLGDETWSARIDLTTRAVTRVELVPKALRGRADFFNLGK